MSTESAKYNKENIDQTEETIDQIGKIDAEKDDKHLQLTVAEQKLWARGGTDRNRLLADKQQLQKETEDQMRKLAGEKLLPTDKNAELLDEIDKLGPDKLRLVQAHLKEIAEKEGEKVKELEPDDPELLGLELKF